MRSGSAAAAISWKAAAITAKARSSASRGRAAEVAAVGKARGVHDRIDRSKRGARRLDQRSTCPRPGKIAGLDLDPGALAPASLRDRIQPRKAGGLGALAVQHQRLIGTGEPARDRGADAGTAACDD